MADRPASPRSGAPSPSASSSKSNRDPSLYLDEHGDLPFYFLDAAEPQLQDKGGSREGAKVVLFGKVPSPQKEGQFDSCSVVVKGFYRHCYFHKARQEVRQEDGSIVYGDYVSDDEAEKEIEACLLRLGVREVMMKPVKKNYPFSFMIDKSKEGQQISREGEYMKVLYPSAYPSLSKRELKGRTFTHVFQESQSMLELLILGKKIRGPGWLKIRAPTAPAFAKTWCKTEFELTLNDPEMEGDEEEQNVLWMNPQPESPPVTVMSLAVRAVPQPKTGVNEVLMISAVVQKNFSIDGPSKDANKNMSSFTIVRNAPNSSCNFPFGFKEELEKAKKMGHNVTDAASERTLLSLFLAKMHIIDPDFIIGHSFLGFTCGVLMARMDEAKVANMSKLGRLKGLQIEWKKRNKSTNSKSHFVEKLVMTGRLVCDTYTSATELVREKNYSLSTLCHSLLKVERPEVSPSEYSKFFAESSTILRLCNLTEGDALLQLRLASQLMAIPLTKQLTNLAGSLWSRSLSGARAERIDYLLLHEFHNRSYVLPGKPSRDMRAGDSGDGEGEVELMGGGAAGGATATRQGRRKAQYSGGLVLEPKKGLYDTFVLLLDFNSLYPSIIREFNICFTTMDRPKQEKPEGEFAYDLPRDTSLDSMGVLPRMLKMLVEKRQAVKSALKSESDKSSLKAQQLEIRQKALKIMANSMYGCLGFVGSRFYAQPLAEMITMKGREILQQTIDLAEKKMNLDVVYGDTDSIFVDSRSHDISEAKKLGNELKSEVNKLHRDLVIEIDGIFSKILLLKKKKYAAVVYEEGPSGPVLSYELKGIDMVRRDWCQLSREVSKTVVDTLLSKEISKEEVIISIRTTLMEVAETLRTPGKVPLSGLAITKSLTKHPQEYGDKNSQPHVMVAMRKLQRNEPVAVGEQMEYVICKGEGSLAEKAFSPSEVKEQGLEPDIEYYLENQIHPPVARLCASIEGLEEAQLAEALGLDTKKFSSTVDSRAGAFGGQELSDTKPLLQQFDDVEPLTLRCVLCKTCVAFPGVYPFQRKRWSQATAEEESEDESARKQEHALRCSNPACPSHQRGEDGAVPNGSPTKPAASAEAFPVGYLRALVGKKIADFKQRYASGYLLVEEEKGTVKMRRVPLSLKYTPELRVVEEYTSSALYRQLLYYRSLFDVKLAEHMSDDANKERQVNGKHKLELQPLPPSVAISMSSVVRYVSAQLEHSAFQQINLSSLFDTTVM
uniref:DNA polymerase n=1 Tax=Palpitomonas bilix TaxID=652834 RepID=A0A7S3FYH1_9EUKA